MVDKFRDPLLTPRETARHLLIPETTLYEWLRDDAPLVHHIEPEKRGRASVPFVAVIEAYVLRALRDLGMSKQAVRATATAVRREFHTEYGLATKRIATDGVDIFLHYADGEVARAGDGQLPIRDLIDNSFRHITWDPVDEFPTRLRLRQYTDVAPVIIDPRFGSPVLETSRLPVDAVVRAWLAGASLVDVARRYDLTPQQAEVICRAARAA